VGVYLKDNLKAKWAKGMNQVVEHLPSKQEALSSNPTISPIKVHIFPYVKFLVMVVEDL
jgi:hypothetical protein